MDPEPWQIYVHVYNAKDHLQVDRTLLAACFEMHYIDAPYLMQKFGLVELARLGMLTSAPANRAMRACHGKYLEDLAKSMRLTQFIAIRRLPEVSASGRILC